MGQSPSRAAMLVSLLPRQNAEQKASGNDKGKRTLWVKGCVDEPQTSIFKSWALGWDPADWEELANGESRTPSAGSPCEGHLLGLDIAAITMHYGSGDDGTWRGQRKDFWVEHRLDDELITYDQCTLVANDWSDETHKAVWYIDEALYFFNQDDEIVTPDKDVLRIDCTPQPE